MLKPHNKPRIDNRNGKKRIVLNRIQPDRLSGIVSHFVEKPTIDIINGNSFMVTSKSGDISEIGHGIFRNDTRFLSRYVSRINGRTLTTLTSNNTTHYSAAFYLTNPDCPVVEQSNTELRRDVLDIKMTKSIPKEQLTIHRRRFIQQDVREEFFVTNVTEEDLTFTLSFELDADFADLFEVKSLVFMERPDSVQKTFTNRDGDMRRAEGSKGISKSYLKHENAFNFKWSDKLSNFKAQTLIWFSKRGRVQSSGSISFDIKLKPKKTFHVTIVAILLTGRERKRGKYTDQYFQKQEEKIENALNRWNISVPKLETDWDELKHSYYQSLVDIVSLRMSDPLSRHKWELPAAGCPWFMTLFGRDTLITAYQTILFGTNLARGGIEALSEYQATKIDDNKDEEPGKIIHELRFGDYASRSNRFPYYGTMDATPLFLIVASEIFRWTKDISFVERYKKNILRALSWIDNYGDKDGDGFIEYKTKSKDGLENQCWKDSWNGIQFSNGKIAEPPIAACEVQGYVYDAKIRIAEIAKEAWKDNSLAKKLLDEANDLKKIFDEKFWIEDKGYYAIALEKNKKQVDSMTSNNGHLFWSGIVSEDKVNTVVEKLLDETMFSGYGIRTMSTKDKGYSPIGYHVGCVWVHDNSIIANGFAKYGKKKEANMIIDAALDAGPHFGFTFPETFTGFPRYKTDFPVRYPTSSSPQAWAAGSTLLFLRTLLGLKPSPNKKTIEMDPIFDDKKTTIGLEGIDAFGKTFSIELKDGSKPQVIQTG
ncbi:MAG: hypothetical protein OK457_07915 [Thaumarchaeota archaeon]|nr:hypothetical protein [Nitrososphaerota archaeon]